KSATEAARLAVVMAEQQGQGLISRMTGAHRDALGDAVKSANMTVVPYHSSARVLRDGFAPEAIRGKVGILTAGTSDVPVADECRMVVESGGAAAVLIAARAAQGRRRGRSTATIASTTAPTMSNPNTAAATAREASGPPGIAKTSPRARIAARTMTSSHGKPRRRRP